MGMITESDPRFSNGVAIPLDVVQTHGLSPGAKIAYGWLALHPHAGNIREMASNLGRSTRTVRRYFSQLEQHGLIRKG